VHHWHFFASLHCKNVLNNDNYTVLVIEVYYRATFSTSQNVVMLFDWENNGSGG